MPRPNLPRQPPGSCCSTRRHGCLESGPGSRSPSGKSVVELVARIEPAWRHPRPQLGLPVEAREECWHRARPAPPPQDQQLPPLHPRRLMWESRRLPRATLRSRSWLILAAAAVTDEVAAAAGNDEPTAAIGWAAAVAEASLGAAPSCAWAGALCLAPTAGAGVPPACVLALEATCARLATTKFHTR